MKSSLAGFWVAHLGGCDWWHTQDTAHYAAHFDGWRLAKGGADVVTQSVILISKKTFGCLWVRCGCTGAAYAAHCLYSLHMAAGWLPETMDLVAMSSLTNGPCAMVASFSDAFVPANTGAWRCDGRCPPLQHADYACDSARTWAST